MELTRKSVAVEALLAFAGATAAVAALYHLGRAWPLVGDYLQALVAVVFLYVPATMAWRRGRDLREYGFTVRPAGRAAAFGLGVPLVVFPLFLVVFVVFYDQICAASSATWRALAPPGLCRRFLGWEGLEHPRLPPGFAESAFTQLIVVALPEELFFRGYLLARLEEVFPARRRLLGGGVGLALLVSALLFALGHVLVDLDPRRFAVFFPGLLFGWMRSATGSIAAGVLAHASANLYIDALHRTFFR